MRTRNRVSKREQNKKDIETLLVEIIGAAGAVGATITAIEALAGYDRHTIVKYLLVLEQRNTIACRHIGKAKVWSLDTAPLESVFRALVQPKSFIEQVLSAVMGSVPLGLVIVDSQYRILFANETAQKMNKSEAHASPHMISAVDKSAKTFLPPQYIFELFGLENPVRLSRLVALFDAQETVGKQTLLAPNNRWYSLSMQAFSKGNQRAAVVLINDITEQKNAQQLIVDQAALLSAERRALDTAAIIAETDVAGVITHVNDKFCRISGYSRKELLGKTHAVVNSRYHPKSFFSMLWRTIRAGNVWQGEIKNKRKDGSYYWVDSVIAPVLDAQKKPIKYLAIRYDITKYKEPALLRARKSKTKA